MANKYKIIDMETWKRRTYCEIYKKAVQPQYCVSFDLDVTHFRKTVRANSWSFTLAFIYAVTTCANQIEEFRYRFLNGQVVLYEAVDTSFTWLNPETELFKVVNVPMQPSIEEYIRLARETADCQKVPFTGPVPDDVYQFSALPWITFRHVSHTDFGDPEKAQPIFDWGKFYQNGYKFVMPFAVQVHHGFVDGINIGRLSVLLQDYLNEL
jgi:chloramphenicol O-acetyltransferase type B